MILQKTIPSIERSLIFDRIVESWMGKVKSKSEAMAGVCQRKDIINPLQKSLGTEILQLLLRLPEIVDPKAF